MPRIRHVHLLIAICAVALLLAQMLGALHRVQHARHGHSFTTTLSLTSSTSTPVASRSLFGNHDTAGACDLYDQMSHGDALWSSPVVVAPVAFAVPVERVHRTWHLAAQAAGFLARGPPTLS